MNILYITQSFSLNVGGSESVFYNWAEGMSKRGHQIDVICHQINDLNENNNLENITVHRIKPPLKHKGELPRSITQNAMYIINATRKGSQIIKQKKINIIHANFFGPAIVGSILAKLHNIPIATTVHHIFPPDYWKKWVTRHNLSSISSIMGPFFQKAYLRMPTDIIIPVSNSTKEDLLKYDRKHSIRVIPNGIDLTEYDDLKFKKDYQKYILFVGRLVFYKNLDVIISSFKEVVQKIPDIKLIIVGNGPMLDIWQKTVSELDLNQNIEFTGYVSDKKKMELMSGCSALVLPSLIEGFPLVLLEAFAMSKPVLVADAKQYVDIVDEGTDGFILPAHNPDKWSEKIIFLLSNKIVCESMGRKGRLKVESKFNINNTLSQMESLYLTLCSNSQQGLPLRLAIPDVK